MSLADKVTSIKDIVSLVVSLLPKVVDTIIEIIALIKDAKTV